MWKPIHASVWNDIMFTWHRARARSLATLAPLYLGAECVGRFSCSRLLRFFGGGTVAGPKRSEEEVAGSLNDCCSKLNVVQEPERQLTG